MRIFYDAFPEFDLLLGWRSRSPVPENLGLLLDRSTIRLIYYSTHRFNCHQLDISLISAISAVRGLPAVPPWSPQPVRIASWCPYTVPLVCHSLFHSSALPRGARRSAFLACRRSRRGRCSLSTSRQGVLSRCGWSAARYCTPRALPRGARRPAFTLRYGMSLCCFCYTIR